MGKKAAKATRKFAASGELKRAIKERRKHKAVKQKVLARGAEKERKRRSREQDEEQEEEGPQVTSVDDFLSGAFMEGEPVPESDSESEESEVDDDESFASLDDDEGAAHAMDLAALKTNDPEFYKYLQENDKDLLDFHADADLPPDDDMDTDETPILTSDILKAWQRSLIETHSLRALRKLLVAFRAAAYMNDEDVKTAWRIDSSLVFNKLVTTALKYTPIVAAHHMPYKTLPDGKFKPPASTAKTASLTKLLLSHVHNATHLIGQLPSNPVTSDKYDDDESDDEPKKKSKSKSKSKKQDSDSEGQTALIELALTETGKLAPYVVGSRKALKSWLKRCLELWSSAADSVRMSAFLAVRRLAFSSDEGVVELVHKNTYLALLRSSKSTTQHNLPSLTLMKNTASELYVLDPAAAYTTTFGYIRQLAVHLRASTKVKTKEAYKQVYNWQFVHCVDFWSIVLARGCADPESELQPLIYPLVQIGLGAVGLIPSTRYHPLHLHLLRSLTHLAHHTKTYIPIPAQLLPILTSHLSPTTKPSSSLRPLNLDVTIRAPTAYLKSSLLAETIVTEAVALLAESLPLRSVAFPELVVPITSTLKRSLKRAGKVNSKIVTSIKSLVEHVEEHATWVAERRKSLEFSPSQWEEVQRWEEGVKVNETPVGKWVKVLGKQREARRRLVESGGGVVDN